MKNKKLKNDFLTAVPFIFWFEATVIILSTLVNLVYFSADQLFVYLFSLISAGLLIVIGIMLRIRKETAIIYCWIFLISYFLLLSTSLVVRISNFFILLINLALVIYLSFSKRD